MSVLEFKKATMKDIYIKLFIYGDTGVGKTYTSLASFDKVGLLDLGKGAALYADEFSFIKIETTSFDDVFETIQGLQKESLGINTLIIDDISIIWSDLQELGDSKFDKTSPKMWGWIKLRWKALMRALLDLNMNVVATSREKIQYGENMSVLGITFDAEKGTKYEFDTVIRLTMQGGLRKGVILKDRTNKFITGSTISFDSNTFKEHWGVLLDKKAKKSDLATKEQIATFNRLIEDMNPLTIQRTLKEKYGVSKIEDTLKEAANVIIKKMQAN